MEYHFVKNFVPTLKNTYDKLLLIKCVLSNLFFRMKWLQHTGSPKSKIEKCEFSDKKTVEKYQFTGFDIQRKMKKKTR